MRMDLSIAARMESTPIAHSNNNNNIYNNNNNNWALRRKAGTNSSAARCVYVCVNERILYSFFDLFVIDYFLCF